jgi:serine/threonine protein kinase
MTRFPEGNRMPVAGDLGDLDTKNWENLQQLADSLEESWRQGRPADLSAMLPPPGTAIRPVILRELIKTDLECRWRHGQPALLESYLEKFPTDLGPAASLSAALIYEEYRVRQLFGDRPPLEQFRTRFPGQFAEVERLLRDNPLPPPPAAQPSSAGAASGTPVLSSARAGEAGHASFGKNVVLSQTGGYTLLERIGTGGFAEVWKAQAPGGVLKAIKIIIRPIDQAESKREEEAMELIKNLRHHFLLPVHAFWPSQDRLIILMDLADESLRDRLNKYTKEGVPAIPLPELIRYMRQAAEALDYLHAKKVQHRDIKPENLLLCDGHVRVADFGLAKAQGTQRMATGTFAGTPLYMPPETWEDKTHVHGDQYSLAATFFELRTGRRLYKNAALPSLMHSHLHETPSLDPLGQEEQQVLLRALAKDPEERYPDCLTFVHALEKAVVGEMPAGAVPWSIAASPTETGDAVNTIIPSAGARPASWRAPARQAGAVSGDTYQGKETLAPPAVQQPPSKSSRKIAALAASLVVLGLLAFPAWLALKPAPATGDLTLLPVAAQTGRAGQRATLPVSIKRENFAEQVQLKFASDRDIIFEEAVIPSGATTADVKWRAADRATPGPHRVTMEASGGVHCAYLVVDVIITPGGN